VLPKEDRFSNTSITHLQDEECQVEDITGFSTYENDRKLWFAYVLQENDSKIKRSILHISGPIKFLMCPSPPDILWVSASKVLRKVCSVTAIGRTYVISETRILLQN
jgi:hypothetical protein